MVEWIYTAAILVAWAQGIAFGWMLGRRSERALRLRLIEAVERSFGMTGPN